MFKQAAALFIGGFLAIGAQAQCGPFPLAQLNSIQLSAVSAEEISASAASRESATDNRASAWEILAKREAAEQAQIDQAIATYEAHLAKVDDVEVAVTESTAEPEAPQAEERTVQAAMDVTEVVVSIVADEQEDSTAAPSQELAENQELVVMDGVSIILTTDMTEKERAAYARKPADDEIVRSMSEQMKTAATYAQQANEQAAAMLEILGQLKSETEQLNSELKALREEVKKERAKAAQAALDAEKLVEERLALRQAVETAAFGEESVCVRTECATTAAQILSIPDSAAPLGGDGSLSKTG